MVIITKIKKNIIFHPFFFALFPTLFLYAYNISKIPLEAVIGPLIIISSIVILLWGLLSLIIKDKEKSALIISVTLVFFFSYGHLYQIIKATGLNLTIGRAFIEINGVLFPIWGTLLFIAIYSIIKTKRTLYNFTVVFNIIGVSLIIISLMNIGSYKYNTKGLWKKPELEASYIDNGVKNISRPNIYYIILDAYAGENILKEIYGYDNTNFLTYLTKKGFFVASDSTSNYNQTSLSLASSLNLDYLDKLAARVGKRTYDHSPLRRGIKYNKVFKFLKQQGYTIVAFQSGEINTEIDNADIYITPRWAFDEFQNMLINTTPIPVIADILNTQDLFDLHRNRILYILEHLDDTCRFSSPIFVFAHIEAPHPPFVFGKNGEKVKFIKSFNNFDANWLIKKGGLTHAEYIKGYRDQLIFITKKIKIAIDGILSKSKNPPVIILQADHGPRSMLVWENPKKTYFKESMSILNAYYLPDKNYKIFYAKITPVNTFRAVFNHCFGTDYKLLADKNYYSTAQHPYDFIEVTDKIK